MSHFLAGIALPSAIPSPSVSAWNLGPFVIRAYAVAVLVGIFVAIWVGDRRWVRRGGIKGTVYDVAIWAVPFGIVGGRLYHVATDWPAYFGPDGAGFGAALAIWRGGLGIWGAISLGAVGAWIAVRRAGIVFPPMADALCVGVALGQAIGRWGNWFNQELFGRPTDLPWALEIAPSNRPAGYLQYETFHPTFLYESLWLLVVAGICVWADKRFRMGHGRVAALYVALYCLGRLGMEMLRIDPATHVGGVRINVITSVLVGCGGVAYLIASARLRPGREAPELLQPGARWVDQDRVVGGDQGVLDQSGLDQSGADMSVEAAHALPAVCEAHGRSIKRRSIKNSENGAAPAVTSPQVSPEQVSPEQVSPEQVSPEQVSPEQVRPGPPVETFDAGKRATARGEGTGDAHLGRD